MRVCVAFVCAAVMMLVSVDLAIADDPEPLEVGQKAPPVALKDQQGGERSLDEFLKRGKVALVFYRSADW